MSFLKRLGNLFNSDQNSGFDDRSYWVYVRCNRCGEQLHSRINLYNDLSVEYGGENDQTYHCRKTIVGRTGCFQRIEVKLNFDKNRKLSERQISGGEFITPEEYLVDNEGD